MAARPCISCNSLPGAGPNPHNAKNLRPAAAEKMMMMASSAKGRQDSKAGSGIGRSTDKKAFEQ